MSRRTSSEYETFFGSKSVRAQRCKAKDDVIKSILGRLDVRRLKEYAALLMPCLYGPELSILRALPIPKKTLFAIEREPTIFKDMRRKLDVRMPPFPMNASMALDYIEAEHASGFHLIYLDFLSRPDWDHLEMLEKIFRFGMLRTRSKLILTFGRNRSHASTKALNDLLLQRRPQAILPTDSFIRLMIEKTGHRSYRKIANHPYKSFRNFTYVTTEADF